MGRGWIEPIDVVGVLFILIIVLWCTELIQKIRSRRQ
jgi:hypothetical protein